MRCNRKTNSFTVTPRKKGQLGLKHYQDLTATQP